MVILGDVTDLKNYFSGDNLLEEHGGICRETLLYNFE